MCYLWTCLLYFTRLCYLDVSTLLHQTVLPGRVCSTKPDCATWTCLFYYTRLCYLDVSPLLCYLDVSVLLHQTVLHGRACFTAACCSLNVSVIKHLKVSVYKSLATRYTCTCAFVQHLKGICQQEPMQHILDLPVVNSFCAAPELTSMRIIFYACCVGGAYDGQRNLETCKWLQKQPAKLFIFDLSSP
jgi:hypothetical protein